MDAGLGTAPVDPELLQARLRALSEPLAQGWAAAITAKALGCLVRVSDVGMAAIEQAVGSRKPPELWAIANDSMAELWLEIEDLRQLVLPLVDAYDATQGGGGAVPVPPPPARAGEAEPESGETPPQSFSGVVARIGETAWAMTFVLGGEVDAFRKRLAQVLKLPDSWELVEAMQDHIGHLRSAVGAMLNGVFAALPAAPGEQHEAGQSLELVSARELRARVFELRDLVLTVEERLTRLRPGDWAVELARARAGVERFIFGPGFAWMRATDKRTFLKQRSTLGEILELYSPLRAEPARLAVANLARFLEALEVINQRECLQVHDREALGRVVAAMRAAAASTGPAARQAIAAGLAALAEAQGRDRGLDALLSATLAPGSPVPVAEILARAEQVVAGMGTG